MALPDIDEVLKKGRKKPALTSLPDIDEVLGKRSSLPEIDDVIQSKRQSLPDIDSVIKPGLQASASQSQPSLLSKVLSVPKAIDRSITDFLEGGANTLTLGGFNKLKKYSQEEISPSIARKAGEITGEVLGVGKLYSLAGKGLAKVAPKLTGIKKVGALGATAGAGYQTAKEAADIAFDTREDGSQSLGQRALNVGVEGAIFGGIDVGLRGVGKLAEKTGLSSKLKDVAGNLTQRLKPQEAAATLEKELPTLSPKMPKNPSKAPETLSEAIGLAERTKATEQAVKETERKIANLNKNIEEKGITSRMQGRMGELRKELAANKAILSNREAKMGRTNIENLKVGPVQYTPDTVKGLVKVAAQNIDFSKLKDFSGFKFNTTDLYRNFRNVFKDKFPQMKKLILEPFNASKAEYAQMQINLTQQLKENVVDKFGITKGSRLSALVQDFGEKKISMDELKSQAPKDWQKVVKADQWFRKTYDDILDRINETRAKVYPNNPDKIIPKRQDYYRHFREMNDIVGLKNIFESPAAIDTKLVSLSEYTQPKSKFQGFMQRRGLGPYKKDAVGGFLEYIPGASYATHIDPHINVFKKLADEIATQTEQTRNVNNLINYLNKYSQDLAGKTNAADRWIQDNIPGGRKTMGVVRWINNRVKANTILGNAASTLAQLGNVPNGLAVAKQYSIPGAGRTLKSVIDRKNSLVMQSPFLKERYVDKNFRQFDTRWFEQPRKLAEWAIETADRIGTEFIWNSLYEQGLAQKLPNPLEYADDMTRKLVAGRGVGEVPLLQKANVFQVLAPFQLEVANYWRVLGDLVKTKDATGIMTLFVASFMLNKGMEELRGSGIVFDPIQAIREAVTVARDETKSSAERTFGAAGRLGGEVLSNFPFGQTIAAAYPEYGMEAFGKTLPSREKLFGDNDPTRFGGGLLAMKSLSDPLRYAVLPFGGSQVSKTYRGIQSLTQSGLEKNEKLRFPVERTPGNLIKAPLFGPSATTEGREYYKQNRRPLSEEQTLDVKESGDPTATYEEIQNDREIKRIKDQIKNIEKDEKIKDKEKERRIDALYEKLQQARGW